MDAGTHDTLVRLGVGLIWWLSPILTAVVSVVFFRASPRTDSIVRRVGASAHGVAISAIYVGAMEISWSGHANLANSKPFSCLLLLPLGLIVVSFVLFRGRKWWHLLHVLNLLCLWWTAFVGSMLVTGDAL